MRWLGLGCRIAAELFDGESWHGLARRQQRLALDAGALRLLPQALNFRSVAECMHAATSPAPRPDRGAASIASSTGIPMLAYGPLALAAWRGTAPRPPR